MITSRIIQFYHVLQCWPETSTTHKSVSACCTHWSFLQLLFVNLTEVKLQFKMLNKPSGCWPKTLIRWPWKPYFGRIFFCTLKANSSANTFEEAGRTACWPRRIHAFQVRDLDGFNMSQPNICHHQRKPQNLKVPILLQGIVVTSD